jgi:hypothetical protein
MNMVQNAKTTDDRSTNQETARRDANTAPAFKPVGIPALVAAVRAIRPQPPRVGKRELPAILRKDANLG